MKLQLQLETIPVWDGVKEGSECFLCTLMKKAEEDGIRYYLSSAVMTPEVRVEMNEHGFCPHHSALLAEGGKPQALALAMDTYYDENKRLFAPLYGKVMDAGNARKAEKAAAALFEETHRRESGCLVCSRMEERLLRYAYTVASLWRDDQDFCKALEDSKGFCLHHTESLIRIAPEALSGDDLRDFIKAMVAGGWTEARRLQAHRRGQGHRPRAEVAFLLLSDSRSCPSSPIFPSSMVHLLRISSERVILSMCR